MLQKLRAALTFAHVTSFIALCVALMGGVAYAADTVFSEDIVNGEVKTVDLANAAVTSNKLAASSVTSGKLAGNSVVSSKVLNGTLVGDDLADETITGQKIQNSTIGAAELAGDSVTGAKILDNEVGAADVRDDTLGGGLGAADLQADAVGPSEIQTDAVQASEIQDNAIDSGEIVDFGLSNQDIGVLFAEVSSAGVLDNSSGAGVSVLKLGTGNYEVDFSLDITLCTAVATIGPSGAGSALGEVNVADRAGNPEAIFVDTNASDGTAVDKPFRLVVVC